MNILAFDTSSDVLDIAIQNDEEFFQYNTKKGLKHSELLLPSIENLLTESSLKITDLDCIVCARGPGSFTGLRIGIATAKGLSEGSGIPLISIPTLDAYGDKYSFCDKIIIPVIDAKKKRFFTCFYKNGVKESDYLDLSCEDIINLFDPNNQYLITGPASDLFKERIGSVNSNITFDNTQNNGCALSLISLGKVLNNNKEYDSDSEGPIYIRKSEAEISLEQKNGKR